MQPNILILMVDQLNGTLFPDGPADWLHAPNLKKLAARSTRFKNAYTASPLCAPGRAAFMSGQLPSATGVYDNAAEFPSSTAYMYSTYEEECEAEPSDREKIIVLGGGPNRIGQGIEFDYCCVHAALAMREDGYETIMVNCNPETVSTDYDTSDRLYFEPVTLEDVLAIVDLEKPKGMIVQFGGQTPLKLVEALEAYGVPIIGTDADAIDRAEDRERFQDVLNKLELLQPDNRTATDLESGLKGAGEIGYPLVVRPSYPAEYTTWRRPGNGLRVGHGIPADRERCDRSHA